MSKPTAVVATKPVLPEYVKVCPSCDGAGTYTQMYTAGCGMGYYKAPGPCMQCGPGQAWEGVGYVYKATGQPVGKSVLAQIAVANAEAA